MGDALLATEVLALLGLELVCGLAGNVGEELVDPLVELVVSNAVTDNGERALGVDSGGEFGDRLGIDVLVDRDRGVDVERLAEAAVEGKAVGGVLGKTGGVGEEGLLVQLQERVDLLVKDVACGLLVPIRSKFRF